MVPTSVTKTALYRDLAGEVLRDAPADACVIADEDLANCSVYNPLLQHIVHPMTDAGSDRTQHTQEEKEDVREFARLRRASEATMAYVKSWAYLSDGMPREHVQHANTVWFLALGLCLSQRGHASLQVFE